MIVSFMLEHCKRIVTHTLAEKIENMVDIVRDTISGPARTGSKSIGTTPTQIGDSGELFSGVSLASDENNAGTLYVGFNDKVTPGTVSQTDGFPIIAGGQVPVSVTNMSKLWIVASQVAQKLFWLAQ